jgi:hypothetical protein
MVAVMEEVGLFIDEKCSRFQVLLYRNASDSINLYKKLTVAAATYPYLELDKSSSHPISLSYV